VAGAEPRRNRVFKSMNRPLTILGAERRLFFVALVAGAAVFNLLHSLLGGLILFVCGLVAAQWATKFDPQILRVLLNSSKFKTVYDPGRFEPENIVIKANVGTGKNR
jgi:type IV secretory pathway TrbD component